MALAIWMVAPLKDAGEAYHTALLLDTIGSIFPVGIAYGPWAA